MKLRMTSVFFLTLCFVWLAALSGAVPVMAVRSPAADEAASPLPSGTPTPTHTPAPTGTPVPTEAPVPENTPVPTDEPIPAETELPSPADVTVIATTITGDSLLNNDTYYNIDPQALLEEGFDLTFAPEGYQVLILHTHATESYTPDAENFYVPTGEYRTTDTDFSVVRVGQELADALTERGVRVLHDTGLYDYPSYSGSYARSGAAIEEYLAAYPGIRLVIDLHRDALGDGDRIYKTVSDDAGLQAAQIMFVMGSDVNLDHPRWRENLKLALTLQQAVQARYDTLMRPISLCDYRYNQQLTDGSLLLEVGTAGNTLEEAINAVRLFADAVAPLLTAPPAD